MDKSLKFFYSLYQNNQGVKLDPVTGLPLTNVEGDVNINYYDKTDPTLVVRRETKKYSFQAGAENGQVINYLGNSPLNDIPGIPINPEEDSDIRLSSIIEWTQKNNKRLTLKPKDFVSLKDFNTQPANKLIVLRRFGGASPHNLFSNTTNQEPISTLVGYYDMENLPVKISFNEKWVNFDSTFLAVIQDVIGIKIESIPGIGDQLKKASESPLGQDLMYQVLSKMGVVAGGGGQMPYGNPNLIHEAAMRDVSGEGLSTGLESSIGVEFETRYVMNEQMGTDGRINMLSLISEVHKMGTSNGSFVSGNSPQLKELFKGLQNGDISTIINAFKDAISEVIELAKSLVAEVVETVKTATSKSSIQDGLEVVKTEGLKVLQSFQDAGADFAKARFSRYRWKIKGAIGALSGAHTAPWHISLGNPKHPWFVCGNMILETCEIIPGGEMSYHDMFTEFTVKIKLKSGRTMHKGELESLFNSGTGRIYDKPEKLLTYNVVDGTEVIVPANGGTIVVNNEGGNFSNNRPINPDLPNLLTGYKENTGGIAPFGPQSS